MLAPVRENVLLLRLVGGPPAFILFESIRRRRLMRPKFLLFAFLILPLLAAQAQHHFRVLHSFGADKDGAGVWDSVTLDASGNVYGTTSGRGVYGGGTVFQLTPMPDGRWKETILHSFPSSKDDGAGPYGGLVFDVEGNLYGTTQSFGRYDGGVAFELKAGRRGWVESVIHNFGGPGDPTCCPWGNLVVDQRGELYGTSYSAFELLPGPKGWTEKILHEFTGKNGDGLGPQAGPIMDVAGNLYGTTAMGGGGPLYSDGCGTVWELQPPAGDDTSSAKAWKEHILHRFGFSGNDGVGPSLGQLAMDPEGNLYGAADGGKLPGGIVFKLTRVAGSSGVTWREAILYNFTGGADGNHPGGGVILDGAGNLYGTTIAGGNGNGVVFKLSPRSQGGWKYTLLHTFVGSDGSQPDANLTLGPDGKLYGTTATGGAHGGGVVFQLTP
jgi:uncharacterized repeat protein (TIGR03803 family)